MDYKIMIDQYLGQLYSDNSRLETACAYALKNGGKRLRPVLFLNTLEALGVAPLDYLSVAASIELIHTYSLIHDDLPAMDDDTLRRGKPTVHIAYDEATAILAGDALLTDAFLILTKAEHVDLDVRVALIRVLSEKSGSRGMVLGQAYDLSSEGQSISIDDLRRIHSLKTARLIEVSFLMAALIARRQDTYQFERIGHSLGLAFQMQDDLLDVISDEETTGKSLSDEKREKSTYVKLLGINRTKHECTLLFNDVYEGLDTLAIHSNTLVETIKKIELRIK
ncbi:MAG: polyprenyl synthetase family protein [Bacillota bacterium]